jgi:hypothetical protein
MIVILFGPNYFEDFDSKSAFAYAIMTARAEGTIGARGLSCISIHCLGLPFRLMAIMRGIADQEVMRTKQLLRAFSYGDRTVTAPLLISVRNTLKCLSAKSLVASHHSNGVSSTLEISL